MVQWETGKVHPVPAPREHKLNTYQVRSLSPTPVVMSDGPSPLFDPPHTIDEKETPSIANCWRLNEKNEESRDPIDLAIISIPEYILHVNFDPNRTGLGPSGKRGIWIYTSNSLRATKISFENTNFEEQLWISIRLRNHDMLLLGGIYRSPSKDITTSTKDLCALLKMVIDTNPSHLIILGDFN